MIDPVSPNRVLFKNLRKQMIRAILITGCFVLLAGGMVMSAAAGFGVVVALAGGVEDLFFLSFAESSEFSFLPETP